MPEPHDCPERQMRPSEVEDTGRQRQQSETERTGRVNRANGSMTPAE